MTALAGEPDFAALTSPYRRELLAHCYRMSGSIHDAEDLVQETYLRAWRAYDRFEGRSTVRVWLYAIATRVCLTALEGRLRRPLPSGLGAPSHDYRDGIQAVEPLGDWLQPAPDAMLLAVDPADIAVERASVRLALIAALQHLPARQRAVLILRDVLAWHAAEVAELLETTTVAVNSALQRARNQLATATEEDLSEPDDPATRATLERYVEAFERADVTTLAGLLRHDVRLEMPPNRTWFVGSDTMIAFLAERVFGGPGRWQLVPVSANGQPGLASYLRTADGCLRAHGVQVLEVVKGEIVHVVAFNDASLVPAFGLPALYEPPAPR